MKELTIVFAESLIDFLVSISIPYTQDKTGKIVFSVPEGEEFNIGVQYGIYQNKPK